MGNYEDYDYGLMINSAVRYALGRSTYIVDTTINYVKRNIDKLDRNTLFVMTKDIDSDIDFNRKILEASKIYNENPTFEKEWIEFSDYIKKELKKR